MLTTDPNNPKLCRGIDKEKTPQCEVYLVLSEDERKKGFIRPVRKNYIHVGENPIFYKNSHVLTKVGKGGCGTLTKMGIELSETYARKPEFYSHTYCVGCSKHLPVQEFVWEGTNEKVGS